MYGKGKLRVFCKLSFCKKTRKFEATSCWRAVSCRSFFYHRKAHRAAVEKKYQKRSRAVTLVERRAIEQMKAGGATTSGPRGPRAPARRARSRRRSRSPSAPARGPRGQARPGCRKCAAPRRPAPRISILIVELQLSGFDCQKLIFLCRYI